MKTKSRKGKQFSVRLADLKFAQCLKCKHLEPDSKCAAFPKRIPQEILENRHDHRQPFPGDRGIRFEPQE